MTIVFVKLYLLSTHRLTCTAKSLSKSCPFCNSQLVKQEQDVPNITPRHKMVVSHCKSS
jgi:hypothetical protein